MRQPEVKELPIKFVPHRRYIMTAMLAGLPDDEINALCVIRSYNVLPDYIMDDIRGQCLNIPGGKKMMTMNQDRYKYGEPEPFVDDKVAHAMKHNKFFVDLLHLTYGSKKRSFGCMETSRIQKIVERKKERTYLEIAAIQGQPIDVITEYYKRIIPEKYTKKTMMVFIGYFYSYYWEANIANLRRNKCDIYDIARYIHLDDQNKYYAPHRNFMFATHQVLSAYMGLTDDIDRRSLNSELWGKLYMEVEAALNVSNKNLPKWIVDLFSKINDGLIAEEEIKGMQYYREKITQITARAIAMSKIRSSRDDLKKKIPQDVVPEQDEAVDPRKRDSE